MRRIGLLLVTALAGFLFGCETPSTTKQSFLPYVGATYSAGADGELGVFSVYLAEGKISGPAINDALVTFDGKVISNTGGGAYWNFSAPNPVGGESHTLKISHPTAFSLISVTVTVPSGPAPAFTVSPAPPVFPAKRDTSVPGFFELTPSAAVWPASGVRVLLKGYDASNSRQYSITSSVKGSTAASGTFPVDKGLRVGFEVRNEVSVSVPGATSDSFFRTDGDQVAKLGFDPLVELAPYRLEMRIQKGEYFPGMDVNASIRDSNYLTGATFKVDGVEVVEQATKGTYYGSFPTAWADGSVHSYSITDKAGKVLQGQVTMPTGTLTGLTFSPVKGSLASSYTVSPPPGGWPVGSYVECRGIVSGSSWSTSRTPSGAEELLFNSDFIGKASSITFLAAMQNVYPLEGYQSGSQISVRGPLTQW